MKKIHFLLIVILLLSKLYVQAQGRNKRQNEFLILGTLNDYMGRTLDPREENLLDRYFASEGAMVLMVDSLIKTTYPRKVYNDVKKTKTTITSYFLAMQFNSFYNFKPRGSYTSPGHKEILTGTLKENIFKNEGEKLAFLAGVFLRYGSNSDSAYCISIANSVSKAKMCNKLLKEFGCQPHYNIRRNYIPVGHDVFFHPTSKVLTYLKRYEALHAHLKESERSFIQNKLLESRRKKRSK